ncbi:tryptophan synthase subunit alpha [Chitinophaga solisilvae]|uniref:tryptophan synthase subunit alpha n=1 Tax=Chitinophaga solisilvae TaxID=1233460 RepID=UPI001369F16E|nr:tryptophan synthase subunit alpha [Chitinophaga solisilvae]
MNRITSLFRQKKEQVLSVFFTAGFPALQDTVPVLTALQEAGADLVEIGMPYSDPMADGPVIQASNTRALGNGMSVELLFEQLKDIRTHIHIPILLMGYYNPVLQYGVEQFVTQAAAAGIDGIIIPDLPLQEYEQQYQQLFQAHKLSNVFLVTPQTPEDRLLHIDRLSTGFIYIVSSSSTTGNQQQQQGHDSYFSRIRQTPLQNPALIGFNIKDQESFRYACQYAAGAIIGSAFIRVLEQADDLRPAIHAFIQQLRGAAEPLPSVPHRQTATL